ncbi:hypothetical protein Ait01nite_031760 [Actinoplanes italicus]|uniref:Uncharacterized protein n=1 Tax=Actinoplanes italicus TaxID=113567 RepID=A0A2T0KJC1_9ACTN|nr:hypothetical protein [Actinoplanes italicus]PRX23631.1 hypothetical protein CLV67_103380 [Actinoplanes italicus]GIE30131.1 hypothetical protein Ait01nite_031760 [Actinoplanes italicus]
MKTFPHWRAVGRAMLDARRREGVTAPRTVLDNRRGAPAVELTWEREDGLTVGLWRLRSGRSGPDLGVRYPDRADGTNLFAGMDSIDDAGQVLRVLAALELIPADIAYAADERYGRCVKCGRLAQWWPAEAGADDRWVHDVRLRFDGNPHEAEVAS